MKELVIQYDGITVWDGPVDEFTWHDTDSGVTVTGVKKKPSSGGVLSALVAARKAAAQSAPEDAVAQ